MDLRAGRESASCDTFLKTCDMLYKWSPYSAPGLRSVSKIVQCLLNYFLNVLLPDLVQLSSCAKKDKPVECPHTLNLQSTGRNDNGHKKDKEALT